MCMLSAHVSLPTFIHCADCSYFLNIKYITTCVIPYCGIPISSPYTIKFGQKQTQIHYEKLPHPPHGGDFLCRYQCLDRRGGGGGSGYGNRCSIWCFFLFCNHFFGQIPDPLDWKIVQIWWNIPFLGIAKLQLEAKLFLWSKSSNRGPRKCSKAAPMPVPLSLHLNIDTLITATCNLLPPPPPLFLWGLEGYG